MFSSSKKTIVALPESCVAEVDVAIIGGGLSGLSAAQLLKDSNVDNLVVIEARDRVGGRTKCGLAKIPVPGVKTSTDLKESDAREVYFDAGAGYVGPLQDRILRQAKRFGIDTRHVYIKGQNLLALPGSRNSTFSGGIPGLNPLGLIDINYFICKSNALASEIETLDPNRHPRAAEWDRITMEEWKNSEMLSADAKALVDVLIRTLFCVEPCEISLLQWLWYVSSGDCVERLTETERGAQERKFRGGSYRISEALADSIGRDKILLNSPVHHVTINGMDGSSSEHLRPVGTPRDNVSDSGSMESAEDLGSAQGQKSSAAGADKFSVELTLKDGRMIKAKRVIFALPPSMLSKMTFSPPLPANRNQLRHRQPLGSIIKTHMYYSEPWWRDLGLSGLTICPEGPIQVSFDDCREEEDVYCLMGFVVANDAREVAAMTVMQREEHLKKHYAKVFGNDKALVNVGYGENDWSSEEWSAGCYTGVFAAGQMKNFFDIMRQPLGPCHFAGTETAKMWAGYMDGAVESGERAAQEVMQSLRRTKDSKYRSVEPESDVIPHIPIGASAVERALPSGRSIVYGAMTTLALVAAIIIPVLRQR
eukprot:Clim_evm20s247 gene=Clim_evmTU20s247